MPAETKPDETTVDSADQLRLFELYRDYIKHEDELINHRVGWFIQLHSFLIASYGIIFAALVTTFSAQGAPAFGGVAIQVLAAALLVGIALIGLESAGAAEGSIAAAHDAITSLNQSWKAQVARWGEGCSLPDIIRGARRLDSKEQAARRSDADGSELHRKLPLALQRLWKVSFAVPGAFVGLAAWAAFAPG